MVYEIAITFTVITCLCIYKYRQGIKKRIYAKHYDSVTLYSDTNNGNDIDGNTVENTMYVLDGVFEIHITVDPEKNFVKLLNFVKKYEKSKGMKVVYAVSSVKNNQYMLSYFTRKNNDTLAVNSALNIANELCIDGIKVARVKVEGHNVNGTPMTNREYDAIKQYLTNKYDNGCGKPYFEFHVKISNRQTEDLRFDVLENDIQKYNGVAVSHNLCSSDRKPLLTIRVYDKGFINAQKYKDMVINDLKNIGYIFENKIQQEFSIYDSNASIDNGWLINEL